MVNTDIFNLIKDCFYKVYNLGDSIQIFSIGNINVSLNQFLVALAIMSIILTSLLTFARSHGADVTDRAGDSLRAVKNKVMKK